MSNLDKYIEYKQEEEDYYRREEEHETIATAADARHSMPRLVRRLMQWLIWGPVKWHDPTVPTPDRQRLYATDGKDVWEIWGNGEPISPGAIRVKKWAIRREPMPFPPNTAIPNNQPHKTNE